MMYLIPLRKACFYGQEGTKSGIRRRVAVLVVPFYRHDYFFKKPCLYRGMSRLSMLLLLLYFIASVNMTLPMRFKYHILV